MFANMHRLAFLVSHPIQYHSPFFAYVKQHSDLEPVVFYGWDFGIKPTYDKQFKQMVKWNIPLLEGYNSVFLRNFSPNPSSDFLGQINPGIIRALFKGRYDALVVYGWNGITHLLAILTARLLGIPVFMRGENPLSHEVAMSTLKRLAKSVIFPVLFSLISRFLYIGTENKEFYKHYGVAERKLFFMPYAFDDRRFKAARESLQARRIEHRSRLGYAEDDCVILVVGKLMKKKRPLDAIQSFEKMKVRNKKLVFVGSGELEASLKEYVSSHALKNVIFAGFKNQDEIMECYATSDLILMSSEYGETWGIVVSEGMFFGLPAVVSSLAGCGPDMVEEGGNGFIFKVGDTTECAAQLDTLASDKDMRLRFGRRSEEIVVRFSYAEDLRGLQAALESVKSQSNAAS